jgi:hypothetical protein
MSRKAGSRQIAAQSRFDAGRVPRWRCEGLLRQNGRLGQMAKTPAITLALMASDPTALGISRVSLLRGFVFAAIFPFEFDEGRSERASQPAGGRAVGHPSPSLDRRAPCLLAIAAFADLDQGDFTEGGVACTSNLAAKSATSDSVKVPAVPVAVFGATPLQ